LLVREAGSGGREVPSAHLFLPCPRVPYLTGALTQLLPVGPRVAIEETNHLGSAQTALPVLPLCGGPDDRGPYLADAPDAWVAEARITAPDRSNLGRSVEQGHFWA